jgi:hypothetical protein
VFFLLKFKERLQRSEIWDSRATPERLRCVDLPPCR